MAVKTSVDYILKQYYIGLGFSKFVFLSMLARQPNNATAYNIKCILFFCLATYLFHANTLMAQTPYQLPPNQPEQDACNALQLCGGSFYTPYSYTGTGTYLDLDISPCFTGAGGGEQNSVWLKLHVLQAGTIVFKITPVSPADDYDFAVLDITGKSCGSLSSKDVIRCNYNNNIPGSNMNGIIGLSDTSRTPYIQKDSFGISYAEAVFAKSDGVYLIMVNNFGNYVSGGVSKGFTIDFSGSTAQFYNTASPLLKSVDVPCNNANSIIVKTNTNILCSSIAADGSDFTTNAPAQIISASGINCTNRGGYTNSIVINFSSVVSPGNYTLNIKKGSDNNTLADLCNNEIMLPSGSIPFIVKQNGKVAIDNESICYKQLPYFWNGMQINDGGNSVATYTMASAAGCDSTTILNLQVLAAAQQVNISDSICDGASYVLPWDSTVSTGGTYIHHFTNVNGCDSLIESFILSVIIPSSGTVRQRDSTIQTGFCLNGSALLSVGDNFRSYQWNTGQTSSSIVVNIAGVYSLIATDNEGCITIDTFVVARYPFPVPEFQRVENLCKDGIITLDAGAGGTYYLWNTGSTAEAITTNQPGTFWVTSATQHNCSATDTVTVVTVQGPSNFLPPDVTKCSNKQVTLTPLNNFNLYTWSNGEHVKSINVSAAGLYWLNVTDYNGCAGKDSIVVIDSLCPTYFYMPNAFTPNNDGHNDVFKPSFSGTLSRYHLSIYNRWGKLIFSTYDPLTGWDGYVESYLQHLGSYVWICSYSLDGNPLQVEKGTVTLIR